MTASEFREYASLGAGRGAGGRVLGLVSAWRVGFGLASGLGERVQGLIDSAPESFKRLKTVVSAMGNTLGELGKLAKMTLPYVPAIARKFWDDNWQYIVAGVTTVVAVGLLFTPLAPAGVLMLSGMAIGGGIELLFQAFSGEPLDKKALANAVSIGGWSNLVGGAALSGTLKVASKLGGASKLMGRSGTAVANFAPRLEKFGVSIAQGAARVKSTVSSVQAATGRAFAPVVSVAQGAERLGAAAVARVPVVNAVAERFIVARGRLDAASSAAGAMASSVGNVAEASVTNVMDYGMNTPLSEQSPGGYARAAAAAPVSTVVVPKLVSKNGENMLRRVEVSSELTKNAGEYIGEYASGFSNYLLTEDDINIRQANREGFKNVSAAFAENLTEKGNGSK